MMDIIEPASGLSLADHVEIQQLYLRYSAAVDFRDVDTWVSTWTDEHPSLVTHHGDVIDGSEQLLAAFRRQITNRGEGGFHFTNAPILDATDYGASGLCYLVHLYPDASGSADGAYRGLPRAVPRYVLYYEDELVQDDGRWRFRRRSAKLMDV